PESNPGKEGHLKPVTAYSYPQLRLKHPTSAPGQNSIGTGGHYWIGANIECADAARARQNFKRLPWWKARCSGLIARSAFIALLAGERHADLGCTPFQRDHPGAV